jgi:hypothetical protein
VRPAWIVFIAISTCGFTVAQDSQKPETPPASAQVPGTATKTGEPLPGAPLFNFLQKKSLVFPDIAESTEPLTSGQKFQLFVDNSVSAHAIAGAAIGAGIGQADNSPTGFGQGWDAYGKRFGASMARQASSEFLGTFILASALHEDPRFFPRLNPTFGQSVKYSLKRIFITRNDSGRDVANISGLLGPAMGEGLANAYWPERNRTVGDTLMRYGLDLATRAGGNLLREYWPVFYAKLRHQVPPDGKRR